MMKLINVGSLLSILAIDAFATPLAERNMMGGQPAICTNLHTQDYGCIRYTRGFDVTGVVTEIDLTFPEVQNECDCIQECLNRLSICANYVWKFSDRAAVKSGHRTCTLYSTFNIPSDVTIDYNIASPLNKNIRPHKLADGNNPQPGGLVPQAFKDLHLNTIPDNDAVSGPVWQLANGKVQC